MWFEGIDTTVTYVEYILVYIDDVVARDEAKDYTAKKEIQDTSIKAEVSCLMCE